MTYFVTGATGFIGRNLIERLLRRDVDIAVLVRESSAERLDQLIERWGARGRVTPVIGDLSQHRLGLDESDLAALGDVTEFFHLAAMYDMTAADDINRTLNVDGTLHAVDAAKAMGATRFHHVSSIAVAGMYPGLFREDMFDEGQTLPSAYHRTKYESEQIVRRQTDIPWRVYRPAIVVGDSKTGEMDKVDGPYYLFKPIQRLRHFVPEWFPLIGPELGTTNIVPVDFVADALDHIAHLPDQDGRAFHLAAPRAIKSGDALNAICRAAHAPELQMRVDKGLLDALPKGTISMLMKLQFAKDMRKTLLADLGIPDVVLDYVGLESQFDTRDTERALEGTGIEVPPLDSYAGKLWDYWERNLDPDLFKDRSFEGAVNGRTVLITGASAGIGKEAAIKIARAGGIPLLVARSEDKLEAVKKEIEALGGTAYVYPADIADMDAIEVLVKKVLDEHPAVDFLVNNAGRSIRRSVALSQDRFHDYERTIQLNYFGAIKLIMELLPHMRERKRGHIVNVSSIGVQANTPRFSAYVASKAALDAFSRVTATETLGDNVTFTTIHMPLVKTDMIAPTKIYDSFPTATPSEAGDLICEAIRARPKELNTRLGTFGVLMNALLPRVSDQILHTAYKLFPDSAAAKGDDDPSERASVEQIAVANLMKGVHW
ncbi:MAG: SDR family oxidoreductase [Solirubrobacteraceae bacterium]|nr:SDR family oxidoreductase [Solirubrobacteraceae bacterium]